MNPTNGKGSERLHDRTKLSDEEMQARWDNIFGKKDKPKDEVKNKLENVVCANCDWKGKRKAGQLVFCPDCNNCATFDI